MERAFRCQYVLHAQLRARQFGRTCCICWLQAGVHIEGEVLPSEFRQGRKSFFPEPVAALCVAPSWLASALGGERLRVRDGVWSPDELFNILGSLQSLPYFGENKTTHKFYNGTLGFHVTFRDTHRKRVEEHLPCLGPILAQTLRSECNVFFLNVFHARPDGQSYHLDNRFTDYCGQQRPSDFVTVAYISVSEAMIGGELVVLNVSDERLPLDRGSENPDEILKKIQPRTGRVVDFDGRLLHSVGAFESAEPRVSLVIEQCKLPRRHFVKSPKFTISCQRTQQDIDMS